MSYKIFLIDRWGSCLHDGRVIFGEISKNRNPRLRASLTRANAEPGASKRRNTALSGQRCQEANKLPWCVLNMPKIVPSSQKRICHVNLYLTELEFSELERAASGQTCLTISQLAYSRYLAGVKLRNTKKGGAR